MACPSKKTFKFRILGSECQTSGTCAKRAKQATNNDNAAACLCFLNYLAFLRPAADRAVSILPWVLSPGRSYGFLWAVRLFKKFEEGQSNSGLFASKRSKTSHGACWSPLVTQWSFLNCLSHINQLAFECHASGEVREWTSAVNKNMDATTF
jgi:hypothetical protein